MLSSQKHRGRAQGLQRAQGWMFTPCAPPWLVDLCPPLAQSQNAKEPLRDTHYSMCSVEKHTSAHPDLLGLPLFGQSVLDMGKERKIDIKVQFGMDIHPASGGRVNSSLLAWSSSFLLSLLLSTHTFCTQMQQMK